MGKPKQAQSIRWTVEMASREFNRDHKAISKNLISTGVQAGEDGKYSTPEIARAVFGDINAERLRKTREEADALAIKNERERGKLIPAESAARVGQSVFVAIRQIILASVLPEEDQDKILLEIQKLKTHDWSKV